MKIFFMRASSAVSSGSEATISSPGSCRQRRSWSVIAVSAGSAASRPRGRPRRCALEAERLRPHLVFSGRHRREVIVAALVGVDRVGDRRAFELGRDRHAAELLARCRRDRAAQQMIGGQRWPETRVAIAATEVRRMPANLASARTSVIGVSPWLIRSRVDGRRSGRRALRTQLDAVHHQSRPNSPGTRAVLSKLTPRIRVEEVDL